MGQHRGGNLPVVVDDLALSVDYAKYSATNAHVAIGDADRHPTLDSVATIHHGIGTAAFAWQAEPAHDRGSIRELIDNRVTGMIVADVASPVQAVADLDGLDRTCMHTDAVTRFGVDQYVTVYERVLADARRR